VVEERKREGAPVDSITMSMPISFHGRLSGLRSDTTVTVRPFTVMVSSPVILMSASNVPRIESYLPPRHTTPTSTPSGASDAKAHALSLPTTGDMRTCPDAGRRGRRVEHGAMKSGVHEHPSECMVWRHGGAEGTGKA